jgi:hypothetical protein
MRFSYIYGIRAGDWIKLLADSELEIALKCLPRACAITVASIVNSFVGSLEDFLYGRRIEQVEIEAHPLFILGHPRSGTTHLHNLLLLDAEFAAPTLPQVFFPHAFLLTERFFSRTFGLRLPKTRGFDNVELGLGTPQEEELALCSLGAPSSYMSLLLPQRVDKYEKCLNLRDLSPDDVERWKRIYVRYLRKLTFRFGRRLALKSSPNTARIRTILELFPEARFVHISRHPYSLFQSYRTFLVYLYKNYAFLQEPDIADLDDDILHYYTKMYDAFFADLPLLAKNRFHNLRFEDLEKSPLSELKLLYEKLELPGFQAVTPKIQSYVERTRRYQKNVYPGLTEAEKNKILFSWKRSFEVWNYEC